MQQVIQETNNKQPTTALIEETARLLTQALYIIDDAYYTDLTNMKKNTKRLRKALQLEERVMEKVKPYIDNDTTYRAIFLLALMMKSTTKVLRKRLREYNRTIIIQKHSPPSYKIIKKKAELKTKIKHDHQAIHNLYEMAHSYLQKGWWQTTNQQEENTKNQQITTM